MSDVPIRIYQIKLYFVFVMFLESTQTNSPNTGCVCATIFLLFFFDHLVYFLLSVMK